VRTRSRIGTACCGLVVLVAGCGGGGERLSSSGYVRGASGICARANRAIARVDLTALDDEARAADAMARVVLIQRSSIDELRALRPPEHLGDLDQRWIALLDQGTDELELMGLRLDDGRHADADTYADNASKLLARARTLVAPHGLTSCRGPTLAPT
jgi:hypothetical protein